MGLKVCGLSIPNVERNIVETQKTTVTYQNSEHQNAQALENLSSKISQAENKDRSTSPDQIQATSNPETPNFETIGGTWRKNEKEDIRFYRNGEDTSNTELFDKEYFKTGENEYVRLNKNGALIDLPENEGKNRPKDVSEFDWLGWENVSADKVPAIYTTEGKTVSFEDAEKAKNEMNVFKRYVVENAVLKDGYWDEAAVVAAYNDFKSKGGKIDVEDCGQTEDGKTQYIVNMNDESLEVFRNEINAIKLEQKKTAINAEIAQDKTNQMFLDLPRIVWNSGVNIVEGGINSTVDVATGGASNVAKSRGIYVPQVDFSGAKVDYRSEMMRRDLNGIVDGEGIKRGDVTEFGVTIGAPLVVGGIGKTTRLTELNLTFSLRNGTSAKIGVTNLQTELDPYVARQVGNEIASNPVASRSYARMQKQGAEVKLDFGNPPNNRTLGQFDYNGNKVTIYMQNNGTAKEAVSTMVHEAKHVKNRFSGRLNSQYDEYQAFCLEFIYKNGRRPNLSERQDIWNMVRKTYSDLPMEKNPLILVLKGKD